MLRKIIYYQVLVSSVLSFLIQDFSCNVTSSPHGQATGDTTIRDLMTLIVEEKRIRFQLEDRLIAAENEINKIKQYDVAVSSEMEKEKNELEQLRTQNQILNDQLANMTAKNTLLESKLGHVSEIFVNMSAKNLLLESRIDHLSRDLTNLSSETRRETANLSMNVHSLELQIADISRNLGNASNLASLNNSSVQVGFTVYNGVSSSGASYNPLKFQSTLYNSDASFNNSTGVFTCIYPGLYFFSATVMRKDGVFGGGEYSCYFVVNGDYRMRVFANDNSNSASFPGSSASIVLRLNKNDSVNLGHCNDGTIYMHTAGVSFTGFRISP